MKLTHFRTNVHKLLNDIFPFYFPFTNKLKQRCLSPIAKQYLQISLTYDCQCTCSHCGMSKYARTGKMLTAHEIFSIIDNLVLWGFGQIDFFGGEPLLDTNIYSYICYAAQKGIFTHVNTNGLLLTKKNVDELARNGLSAISISFDHHDLQKHDRNRGIPHLFARALSGAEMCIKKNILTIMSIYASARDILDGSTEKLIQIAHEKGFYRVRLLSSFKAGKLSEIQAPRHSTDVLNKINEITQNYPFVKTHGINNCFLPYKTTVYISPYGDIQPCSMIPITFGNIRNGDIIHVLQNIRSHPISNIQELGCAMNSDYMKEHFFDKKSVTQSPYPVPSEALAASQETNLIC